MHSTIIPGWIRAVGYYLMLLMLLVGGLTYWNQNIIWGTIGYSVPARLPIALLGATTIAMATIMFLALRSNQPQSLSTVFWLYSLVGFQVPVLMGINIGALDRLYLATGLMILVPVTFVILILTMPAIFGALALSKLNKQQMEMGR